MNLKTPLRLPTMPSMADMENAAPYSSAQPISAGSSASLMKSITALDADVKSPIVVEPKITIEAPSNSTDSHDQNNVTQDFTDITRILSQIRESQAESVIIAQDEQKQSLLSRLSSKISRKDRVDSNSDITSTSTSIALTDQNRNQPADNAGNSKTSKSRALLKALEKQQTKMVKHRDMADARASDRADRNPLLLGALSQLTGGLSDKALRAYDLSKTFKESRNESNNETTESSDSSVNDIDNFTSSEASNSQSSTGDSESSTATSNNSNSSSNSSNSSDTRKSNTRSTSNSVSKTGKSDPMSDFNAPTSINTQSRSVESSRTHNAASLDSSSSSMLSKLDAISLNTSSLLTSFDKIVESDVQVSSSDSKTADVVNSTVSQDDKSTDATSLFKLESSISQLTSEMVKSVENESSNVNGVTSTIELSKVSSTELARDISVSLNSSMDNLKSSLSNLDTATDKNSMFLNQLSIASRKSNVTADHTLDKLTAVVANTDNLENILDTQKQIAEDSERAANSAADGEEGILGTVLEMAGLGGGGAAAIAAIKSKLGFKPKVDADGKPIKSSASKKSTDVPKKSKVEMPKFKGKGAFGLLTRGVAAIGGGYLLNSLLGGAEDVSVNADGSQQAPPSIGDMADSARNQAYGGFAVNAGLDVATNIAHNRATKQAGKKVAEVGAEKSAKVMATKAAGEVSKEAAEKVGGKVAAKQGAKFFLKKIPLIGLGIGMFDAVSEAMDGNWGRAAASLASGIASTAPGLGTVVSTAIDGALLVDTLGDIDEQEAKAVAQQRDTGSPDLVATVNANRILSESGVETNTDVSSIIAKSNSIVEPDRLASMSDPLSGIEISKLATVSESNSKVSDEVTTSVSKALASVKGSNKSSKKVTTASPIVKSGFDVSDPGIQAMGMGNQYV